MTMYISLPTFQWYTKYPKYLAYVHKIFNLAYINSGGVHKGHYLANIHNGGVHKRHYLANIHNGGVHKEPYIAYVHSGGVHKTTFRHCVHSGGVNILCPFLKLNLCHTKKNQTLSQNKTVQMPMFLGEHHRDTGLIRTLWI